MLCACDSTSRLCLGALNLDWELCKFNHASFGNGHVSTNREMIFFIQKVILEDYNIHSPSYYISLFYLYFKKKNLSQIYQKLTYTSLFLQKIKLLFFNFLLKIFNMNLILKE